MSRRGGLPAVPGRGRCVAVAFSGGRDSIALLHATCRAAAVLGVEVLAIHVHHGLLPEADAWLRHARALVARWRRRGWPVRCAAARLPGSPGPGDSIEAWARAGRHAALARLAREGGATLLLLAHHRRDQAETVLLQALRGGGPAGLAGMPRRVERGGLTWARPWLDQPREAIDAYVRRHRLRPVDDPSNDDTRYARNRLRRAVWPAFTTAFPEAEAALAAVARRAQEADAALAELAGMDLAGCTDRRGHLDVARWRRLSPPRQANALRAWWWRSAGRGAPETLIGRLLAELPAGDQPARLALPAAGPSARRWPAVDGLEAACVGGWLWLDAVAARPEDDGGRPEVPDLIELDLSQPGEHPVPAWRGRFIVEPCDAGGLAVEDLRHVQARPRQGGEQFQLGPGRPPRRLKKQFQALGLGAGAARDGPLLWRDGRLLFVPGLGADARAFATAGAPCCALRWVPDGAAPEPPSGPHKPAD